MFRPPGIKEVQIHSGSTKLCLLRAFKRGEVLINLEPSIKQFHTTNSERKRCQGCGAAISFMEVDCPKCSSIFYCSSMCMTRHAYLHDHECASFRQLAESGHGCTVDGLMVTRMLLAIRNDDQLRMDLKKLSPSINKCLDENEAPFPNSLSDPETVRNLQRLLLKYSRPLYDLNQEIVGCFFEPLLAKMSHSCDATITVVSISSEKISLVCARDIDEGTELTVSYIPQAQPRIHRQMQLQLNYCLKCHCPLCLSTMIDPFLSFTCSNCKYPICEINPDEFTGTSHIESSNSQSLKWCPHCRKGLPQSKLIQSKCLYQRCLKVFTRISQPVQKKASSQEAKALPVSAIFEPFDVLRISEGRAKSILELLREVENSNEIPPYCYPIKHLYNILAGSFAFDIMNSTHIIPGTMMIHHDLFTLFHVQLALILSPLPVQLIEILAKAEKFVWNLLQISPADSDKITRIAATRARLFFQVQMAALKVKQGHCDSAVIALAQKYNRNPSLFEDDARRSAERILLCCRIQLKLREIGYTFRLANANEVVVMLPFHECLHRLKSV